MKRAFDLYMKARYLDEQHRGLGVVSMTDATISDAMVELYIMQRFLDPAGLRSRGIDHFDGWAASFGEVVDSMVTSPDGASLRPRSRFAKFVNLPELVQMFRAFADVQTADMLDLPRPDLEGGKPQTIACPMSGQQKDLQAKLIERYDRIRSTKVDPRMDNAGDHHRRPQVGPRRQDARGGGRLRRVEDKRPGRQRDPDLAEDGGHARDADGLLSTDAE